MTADAFFKELERLILSAPKRPSQIVNSENCAYGSFIYYGKNLYTCFDCVNDADGTFLYDSHDCPNCGDCDFCYESQLCYECVDAKKCFNSNYLEYCNNVRDSWYSIGCKNCNDIFGCVDLENKSFCIFNRQLTETEYQQKLQQLKSLPPEKILAVVEQLKLQHPLTQTREENNENASYGNYIYFNKDCYMCFDAGHSENCGYLYDTSHNNGSYDICQCRDIELSKEVIDSGKIFNSTYVMFSGNCQDSSYLFDCLDVKNSIGCVMLAHKQYCILNRQFSAEEYERTSKSLLTELRVKDYGWANLIY